MKEPEVHQLKNGIRIAHKQVEHTKVAHCGIILDIGSRDERESEQGLAHFWEHMAFKGTKKRKAFHIINRLDSVGGELNAFTTKEKISFYASVLEPYFSNAVELLKDITFDSIFPPQQIERERGVILEEMAMYRDSPEDALHDEFDEVIFGNHPLGFNILGTNESVKKFSREDFKLFISRNMDTSRIIFSSVSNMPFKKVIRIAEKYFNDIPEKSALKDRIAFEDYSPSSKSVAKEMSQGLLAMGRPAYAFNDPKRSIFFMLNNILGGPAMNSRLNMALRERRGYVYSIESGYSPYADTGLFGIYFGCEPQHLSKGQELVWKELELLKNKRLGIVQMKAAKEQLMGQIAISEEKNSSFMLMMGKSLLEMDRVESLEEIFNQIESISQEDLLEVANEIFERDRFSILTYHPN